MFDSPTDIHKQVQRVDFNPFSLSTFPDANPSTVSDLSPSSRSQLWHGPSLDVKTKNSDPRGNLTSTALRKKAETSYSSFSFSYWKLTVNTHVLFRRFLLIRIKLSLKLKKSVQVNRMCASFKISFCGFYHFIFSEFYNS